VVGPSPAIVTITATSVADPTKSGAANLTILSSASPAKAGPALPTLPQATVNLTMPTQTGTVRNVPAGNASALQTAIDNSTCGDTIVLTAGSTYSGNFTIPNKTCSGWILVESNGLASLPASGHRVGPSNASNMAIVSTPNTSPAIEFLASSNHWRLIGLEITTSYVSTSNTVYNLVLSDGNSATSAAALPSYVIFDRDYIVGLSNTNVTRGIDMDFATVGIVDSYCDEIHANGNDSQCFASWNGSGPFLIQNNFIQAGAENILFGGADPSIANLVPSDITVVGNLIQKNLAWRGEAASYNWVVKNLFELKNAQRVLLDGNVLQYTWAAGQDEAIILRSVNQGGTCRWCVVQDVTVTHNLIQHTPIGLVIVGSDFGFPFALATQRVLVLNNLLSDINSVTWGGHGWAFELSPGQNPPEHDVIIDHNTGFADQAFLYLTGCDCSGNTNTLSNTQFTNNISDFGAENGITGEASAPGMPALTTWSPGYFYNDFVFAASASGTWPSGTFWSTNLSDIGFTSYSGTGPNLTGNFQLKSGSPYHNAGTDGHDIGMWDWTTFNTETTNALNGIYP
jgi:hypothetical protein